MNIRDESYKEILKGLDGLVMLSQWELTLAQDLRNKAESLAAGNGQADRSAPARDEES